MFLYSVKSLKVIFIPAQQINVSAAFVFKIRTVTLTEPISPHGERSTRGTMSPELLT